jgi:DNA polymerase delta subunit 1
MRQSTYKIESYGLSAVSQRFLKNDKIDLPTQVMFEYILSKDPSKRAEVMRYCVQDALLPVQLWIKLRVLSPLVAMSRVTGVFISDLVTRGQMFKLISLMYIMSRKLGYVLDTLPVPENDKYKGATVLEAQTGVYESIGILDFASLYPNIIKSNNLGYSSLVRSVEYIDIPGFEYKEFVTDVGTCIFQQTIKDILPSTIDILLEMRKVAKKSMKQALNDNNDDLAVLHDNEQLAIKITCNSLYGFTGAGVSPYPCMEVASSTTTIGRNTIDTTKPLIEKHFGHIGARVIYGDTDSVMVATNLTDTADIFRAYHDMAEFITLHFKGGLVLEMENVLSPMISLKKNHYDGLKFSTPDAKGEIYAKGVPLVRRDFCPYERVVYKVALDGLLIDRSVKVALDNIREEFRKLTSGQIDFEDLVMTRKLSDQYVNKNIIQKVVADKMEIRNPGSGPRSGDRVRFVIIHRKSDTTNLPLYKKCEDATYAKIHKCTVDYVYYINHIKKSIMTLLEYYNVSNMTSAVFKEATDTAWQLSSDNVNIRTMLSTPIHIRAGSIEDLRPGKREKSKSTKSTGLFTLEKYFINKRLIKVDGCTKKKRARVDDPSCNISQFINQSICKK